MKVFSTEGEHLTFSSQQNTGRLVGVTILCVGLLLSRTIDPTTASDWLPFQLSCGAITGLPCIFCGLTRALHFLLNGDLARALYFNWLAFPVIAAALLLIGLWTVEMATKRVWWNLCYFPRLNAPRVTLVLSAIVALWIMQVYLAVSQHKQELLNAKGPLYALFVR